MAPSSTVTDVIIPDDDPMIRNVLRASLEAINLNVFVASDGLEAVALAARIQAALIILDLKMPQLNGLLACQRIRQQARNAQTPIVVLTGTLSKDAEAAAVRVGATAFFVKPFRPALFLQALSRYLPLNDTAREKIRRNADRANGIAEVAPASTDRSTSPKPGADGPLDRGKHVLDVLRG